MQYTVRNIPKVVDQALRKWAAERDQSLNEPTTEALTQGLGLGAEPVRHRDLSPLAGTWIEDEDFDKALAQQDQVDQDLWR
ncbi:MAG: hypothetical protein K0U98_08525 [Deltaproteobacteria bacterium]|nr:hypothetical protein [Deltaproteobacteria bacterium]